MGNRLFVCFLGGDLDEEEEEEELMARGSGEREGDLEGELKMCSDSVVGGSLG
jgi:hypothetical protein